MKKTRMDSLGKGMSLSFLILGLLIIIMGVESEGGGAYPQPSNCARYECPEYDVIYSQTLFEIRSYSDANWMAFPVNYARSFKVATKIGFDQLLAYANGKNQDGVNISLTAPVIVDIGSLGNPFSYTLYFYLPQQYQANPPLPLSDLYKPVTLPRYRFAAVRRFGGSLDDGSNARESKALRASLRRTPWQSASAVGPYTVAGYNPPFERNKVNEIIIWFN